MKARPTLLHLALGLSLGLAPGLALAQAPVPYTWKNVNIQGGGFVSGISYSPAQQDLVYARTDVGGAYRWQASTRSWVPITDNISRDDSNYQGIRSIAPDPSDPNRVYLAAGTYTQSWAGTAAILASNDQGATWTRSLLSIKLGGNENGRGSGEPLQVDPNLGTTLYLGSSTDGLWRSTDRSATWSKVASFPVATTPVGTNGISFVVFDKSSSATGTATKTIYVGVLRTGADNLYKSTDGGATWAAVAGAPTALMAHHAAVAADGTLYLAYCNGPGPNDVTAGDVMKYVPSTGTWASIKPTLTTAQTQGGYGGLSLDPQKPGTILVSTIDRWGPGDEVFRTTDGGATWQPLLNWRATAKSNLDHSLSPSNAVSDPHWIADVDVDPFRSANAWFVTGYGAFSSQNITAADLAPPTPANWKFDNQGLEELVPRGLICPPTGAPLVSVVFDIDGYRHVNPDVVPTSRLAPQYGSNVSIDFAELQPSFIVRTHTNAAGKYGAYSTDGAVTFTPFASFPAGASSGGAVAVAADASRLAWEPDAANGQTTGVYYSTNRGTTWTAATGVTANNTSNSLRPVADRVNPLKFYVYDAMAGRVLVSTDGAATFTVGATGFTATPNYLVGDASLRATFGKEGDLWLTCPGTYSGDAAAALYHSTDGGVTFQKVTSAKSAATVGLGKPATAAGYPAVYIVGVVNNTYGFYRSDDAGATWKRLNDDQHQYGYIGQIVGDRQTYGRVYLTTGGRGIVYGDDPSAVLATTPSRTLAAGRLSVYPNPAGHEPVQVSFTEHKPGTVLTIKVFTLSGQLVYHSAAQPAATKGFVRLPTVLTAGVYLVQATDEATTSTTRLVVY